MTADIKTIAAHGCYGVSCITAMTVQSTAGVRRVEASDPALVSETLEELVGDVEVAAIHIGMLGSGKVAKAVADFLSAGTNGRAEQLGKGRFMNVVLDPVLSLSSGADLLDNGGIKVLVERLLPLADVVTPNVDEAADYHRNQGKGSGRDANCGREIPRDGRVGRGDHRRASRR